MKSFAVNWLPVLVLAAAIFIQSCFPSPEIVPSFPLSDKLFHGIVYGILAGLCARALRRAGPISGQQRQTLILAAAAMATLYGASDEWHQSFIAARQADIFDLLADFIGSLAGASLYCRLAVYLKPRAFQSPIDKLIRLL